MDYDLSNKVLKLAKDRIFEDKIYSLWLNELQSMDKETYIDFDGYLKKVKSKQLLNKSGIKRKKKTIKELRLESMKIINDDKKNKLTSTKENLN